MAFVQALYRPQLDAVGLLHPLPGRDPATWVQQLYREQLVEMLVETRADPQLEARLAGIGRNIAADDETDLDETPLAPPDIVGTALVSAARLGGAGFLDKAQTRLADIDNGHERALWLGAIAASHAPSSSAAIAQMVSSPSARGQDVLSLRVVILGGEACPPALVERFAKPGRRVFNSYGPTEATVVATIAELQAGERVSIGQPIPNYTAYVVDEAMALASVDAQGELLIGGPGVALGYLKRGELTAQKFIANPFPSTSNDPVLYRTGDAVSIGADGTIAFHGRIDDQVKIRGFRVELGEIEQALTDQPGVTSAAVTLRQVGGIDQHIAFLVAEPKPDMAALRETLKKRLPPYMVPARFETLAGLPRMTSGKTDRKALAALPLTTQLETIVSNDDPAADSVEAALISAAAAIFPGQPVGPSSDFFNDLGGHSM